MMVRLHAKLQAALIYLIVIDPNDFFSQCLDNHSSPISFSVD